MLLTALLWASAALPGALVLPLMLMLMVAPACLGLGGLHAKNSTLLGPPAGFADTVLFAGPPMMLPAQLASDCCCCCCCCMSRLRLLVLVELKLLMYARSTASTAARNSSAGSKGTACKHASSTLRKFCHAQGVKKHVWGCAKMRVGDQRLTFVPGPGNAANAN
jgi:hypothetical protein